MPCLTPPGTAKTAAIARRPGLRLRGALLAAARPLSRVAAPLPNRWAEHSPIGEQHDDPLEAERQEILSITEAPPARRALRHADIPWNPEVEDSREDAWVVHDHLGLLGRTASALCIGYRSLCRAEDFLADLGPGSRRVFGLGRPIPCDTTCTAPGRAVPGRPQGDPLRPGERSHCPEGGEERPPSRWRDRFRRQGAWGPR